LIKISNFAGSPEGTLNPLPDIITPSMRLDGFTWRAEERPKDKYDIFGDNDDVDKLNKLPFSEIEVEVPSLNKKNFRPLLYMDTSKLVKKKKPIDEKIQYVAWIKRHCKGRVLVRLIGCLAQPGLRFIS
jgi:hypothetical protein